MKVIIDNLNEFYDENVRLVKTVMKREFKDEYPELLKWKLQMLYFDGREWEEICRIDNYLHENEKGSHIHLHERVKRIKISFHEAERVIKEISERILKEKFKKIIPFRR